MYLQTWYISANSRYSNAVMLPPWYCHTQYSVKQTQKVFISPFCILANNLSWLYQSRHITLTVIAIIIFLGTNLRHNLGTKGAGKILDRLSWRVLQIRIAGGSSVFFLPSTLHGWKWHHKVLSTWIPASYRCSDPVVNFPVSSANRRLEKMAKCLKSLLLDFLCAIWEEQIFFFSFPQH